MPLRIYNTLTHSKQEFKSIKKDHVGFYSCGPTVYSFAHMGNMRTYINVDLLKRVLIHEGYKVTHVMNITDVGHLVSDANLGEDKMRLTAEHEHKSIYAVANFYTEEFMADMKRLNLIMPDIMPKATDHVKDMLELIDRLDEKGYLYTVRTGVYYDTSKFKDYGKLMRLSFEALNNYLIAGARVERPVGTRNTTDFAVWRFSTPTEKDMVWDTKYGKGFPGWHIECSAMSMKYLGETFDIHTGGVDHLPIHHPNEIAQSEAATGKKFVNYWVHVEHLHVNGRKMSKSLRNVYTIKDLEEKGYDAMAFKYFVLSAHYKSQLNFTFEALENSQKTLRGIYLFIRKMSDNKNTNGASANKELSDAIKLVKKEFFDSVNNDLNTTLALSKMHHLISVANKAYERGMRKIDSEAVIASMLEFDAILGLDMKSHSAKMEIPKKAEELIAEREALRKERRFKDADKIRETLKNEYGVEVEDTEAGPVWHTE